MSGFGGESSVEIDQDFFDSGYSYSSQAQSSNNYETQEQQANHHPGYSHSYDSQDGRTQTKPAVGSSFSSYASNTGYYNPQTYDYGASGPTTICDPAFSGFMQPKQTSEDYTSFEDEPPLLEDVSPVKASSVIT